jgi:hypothetical protein
MKGHFEHPPDPEQLLPSHPADVHTLHFLFAQVLDPIIMPENVSPCPAAGKSFFLTNFFLFSCGLSKPSA